MINSKRNIIVLQPESDVRDMFMPELVIRRLKAIGNVKWNSLKRQYTIKEVKQMILEADIVISGWGTPAITSDLLEDGKKRLLVHMGGSVAPYTNEDAFARGLKVTCANEIFAASVAEGTMAYLLAGLRQIPMWNQLMKDGKWREDTFVNHSLMMRRVGITGYGAIARKLLLLLKPFDVEILLCSDHLSDREYEELGVRKADLEEIFETCDVISLHNGLTEETQGMITRNLLKKIKKNALFINTARGGLVDEKVLEDMLKENRFYAVLDVYAHEPLDESSMLRKLPNTILMPHMAGPTSDLYEACGNAMVDEIERFMNNKSLKYEVSAESLRYMTAKG